MKKLLSMGLALTALLTLGSCDETTGVIGSSLTDFKDTLSVSADTFYVKSRTLTVDSVLARNITGYLGVIRDPETLNTITGNFMAQFNVLEGFSLPEKDSIATNDEGQIIADSCELRLYYNTFYGDSTAQMKLTAYELQKSLEEGVPIYSNFNPENGYVRQGGLTASRTYTLADFTQEDSLRYDEEWTPNIRLRLNKAYTAQDGTTYNNYGTYLLRTYYAHPEYFTSSYRFNHHVCPGFYYKMDDGIGSMAYVETAQLNIYFRYITPDSVHNYSTSFTSTEEVLQTTTFANDNDALQQMAADGNQTYLKSPAGLITELELPITDIMNGHETDTLNSVKIKLPCYTSTSTTGYELSPTEYLLMIPKDSLHSFFANNSLPDSKTSFLTSYSSSTNAYTFSNISGIVMAMYKAGATSSDWNKVVLVPVSVTTHSTSSSTTITKVAHNMGMSSARLLGGENNPQALQMSVIYSKFPEK